MNYKKTVYDYIDTLLNFIYPRNIYCILCNMPIDRQEKYSICKDCTEKLRFIKGKTCLLCGKPLDELYMPDKCHDCLRDKHFYTKAFSCVEYDEASKSLVYDLKYNNKRYLAFHMAEIMMDRLKKTGLKDIQLIIPVPLHKTKERERTFNQSYLIAKYLGKMMEIDVDRKSLIRIRNTPSQNKLTKVERKQNLKNAFEVVVPGSIKNKNILLVDDVFTTGATADECSRVLLKAGAENVYVITFATGRNV